MAKAIQLLTIALANDQTVRFYGQTVRERNDKSGFTGYCLQSEGGVTLVRLMPSFARSQMQALLSLLARIAQHGRDIPADTAAQFVKPDVPFEDMTIADIQDHLAREGWILTYSPGRKEDHYTLRLTTPTTAGE